MVGGGCMPYCPARELPKILFATRGFSSESESGPLSYSNLKNELPQVCTGLRSPCFETCDSKSLISGCLLSESVPSDLSSNISQSDEMIQREVRAQAQGTFQTLAHLW